VLKKSGILLAVLVLSTFTLAFSASAQTSQVPAAPALQAAQPAAVPVPAFLLTLAPQPPAETPAATGVEWLAVDGPGKPLCRCTTNSQCGSGGACCWWSGQKCGICC
jgi:hypothetical protein